MLASKLPFKEFTALLNPHSRRIVAGIALSAIGRGMTLSLLMVYLHDMRGFTITFGGALMGWGALFGIICTAPLGSLVDHIGPKIVMVIGLVISGISAISFSFVTTHAHAFIAMTLFAFGGQCVWPAQTVILTRVTPEVDRPKIFGFNFMLMNLGLGVGGFSLFNPDSRIINFLLSNYVLVRRGYLFSISLLRMGPQHSACRQIHR
jgi:MFS family permease